MHIHLKGTEDGFTISRCSKIEGQGPAVGCWLEQTANYFDGPEFFKIGTQRSALMAAEVKP